MNQTLRILVVEDEPLIAMVLEDYLESLGHEVAGAVDSVEGALAMVAGGDFDAAILDVHLRGGEASWPVADALVAASKPFLLATGGHVEPPPGRHAQAPVLIKPFTMDGVRLGLDGIAATA
ncbi:MULTISPECIES: response regulator [Sphingomonadales]|nr:MULTISPECIES: response regulator [Sphingomonas]AGH51327.1 response regulator receiver protein [Sphingomonas sp. MM-1]MDX3883985.1 response regulator [Sphingomonas sp.]PTD17265.1 response regulator [Sphingomonas fennica]